MYPCSVEVMLLQIKKKKKINGMIFIGFLIKYKVKYRHKLLRNNAVKSYFDVLPTVSWRVTCLLSGANWEWSNVNSY